MTATDELRRMLDERGVEYEVQREGKLSEAILWRGPIGTMHSAFVSNENPDRRSGRILYATLFITPEQTIEATLGRGTCRAIRFDNLNESNGMGDAWEECSECGALLAVITDNQPTPNYCPNCGRKVVGA